MANNSNAKLYVSVALVADIIQLNEYGYRSDRLDRFCKAAKNDVNLVEYEALRDALNSEIWNCVTDNDMNIIEKTPRYEVLEEIVERCGNFEF